MLDQFINLLVGILGGIISGVMVTLYYRRMDEKRDLQKYFAEFRFYVHQVLMFNNLDDAYQFLQTTMTPLHFDWIELSEKDDTIIQRAHTAFGEIIRLHLDKSIDSIESDLGKTATASDDIYQRFEYIQRELGKIELQCIDLGKKYPKRKYKKKTK